MRCDGKARETEWAFVYRLEGARRKTFQLSSTVPTLELL